MARPYWQEREARKADMNFDDSARQAWLAIRCDHCGHRRDDHDTLLGGTRACEVLNCSCQEFREVEEVSA